MVGANWHTVEQLPWPTEWTAHFGRAAPLVVEIGFGSGLYLAHLARARPDSNVLGVEISIPALRRAGRKAAQQRLDNVRLLQADASAVLLALCRPAAIAAVIINFPDPWPKKGHGHRRLIDDTFLHLLATRLQPGAHLDIATDHDDYAAQIAGCLARSPHFQSRAGAPFVLDDPARIRTKYEQVALDEGRTPRYFPWRLVRPADPADFPIPQEFAMPHVVLRGPADLDEIGRRFRPASLEVEGVHVRFVEVYQSLQHNHLLIETYINEAPIVQRIAIELRPRVGGELVVSLAELGFPRPTAGTHLAVGHLARWLGEEFPATVVVHSSLKEEHVAD